MRLIVTFGYFCWYAFTALVTHWAASPDHQSSIDSVTVPALATSIELAGVVGALLALLPCGAQPATVNRPSAAPDFNTVRLLTIVTPSSS